MFVISCGKAVSLSVVMMAVIIAASTTQAAAVTVNAAGGLSSFDSASFSETAAARRMIGFHASNEPALLPGPVRVLAVVPAHEWLKLVTRSELRVAYEKLYCAWAGSRVATCAGAPMSFSAFRADAEQHGPWIAEVRLLHGANRRPYWVNASAVWSPCLGGSLSQGPRTPLRGCK